MQTGGHPVPHSPDLLHQGGIWKIGYIQLLCSGFKFVSSLTNYDLGQLSSLQFLVMWNRDVILSTHKLLERLNEISGPVTCQRKEIVIFEWSSWYWGVALIFKLTVWELLIQTLLIRISCNIPTFTCHFCFSITLQYKRSQTADLISAYHLRTC